MAYGGFPSQGFNHPFLSAGQGMPPAPGVAVPGVAPTGQFPLNPGMMPGMGPQPSGQFPLNPAAGGGPVMTPPHVIAGQPAVPPGGQPIPNFQNLPPNIQNLVQHYTNGAFGQGGFDRSGWQQALQAWRGQKMDAHNGTGSTSFADWQASRPSRSDY